MRGEGIRTDGLAAVRQAAGDLVSEYDRAYWLSCEREQRFPTEMWQAMGGCGLLGIGIPVEYGGTGGGVTELVGIMEVLSGAGVPLLSYVVNNVSRQLIVRHGATEQNERFVATTVGGQKQVCFALTESDSGTNTRGIRTHAEPTTDGWKVSGEKAFVTVADEADYMLVVARTGPSGTVQDGRAGLSLFVIPSDASGIHRHKMNLSLNSPENQFVVSFHEVPLPQSALIGSQGGAWTYLVEGLITGRLLVASLALGLGDYALSRGIAYAKQRAPFGTPIAAYQALQHPMAHARARLESARLMVYEAARRFDNGEDCGVLADMAKLLASEAAEEGMDVALQAHGGIGFDVDSDVVTLWPMVRLTRVIPITNEVVLNRIGTHLLGLPRSY